MPEMTLFDPLSRAIILHDHTWFGHILKGHPEMSGRRAEVETAIRSPVRICYSMSSVDCRLYYRSDTISTLWIVVVADVVQGFIKTAYLARTIKGTVEW